jgi:hypothetical protein
MDCAFFLYGRNPKTGEVEGPAGSGVLIGKQDTGYGMPWSYYAVTCAHVANGGASIVRLNTRAGGYRYLELEPHEWETHSDAGDLAAVDITERIDRDRDAIQIIPTGIFVNRDFLSSHEIAVGEDGFMLGLFAALAGETRNNVAGRFGNLALLAGKSIPIRQPNGSVRPCHIFDLHSRPGFSGSPVFIYRTPGSDLRHVNLPPNYADEMWRKHKVVVVTDLNSDKNQFLRLLGIHLDQYREPVNIRKQRKSGEAAAPVLEGDDLEIPGSMTIVAPAWDVETLLDKLVFVEMRGKRQAALTKGATSSGKPYPGGGESVSAKEASTEQASDNPSHKEDFTRLLNAASKAK